MKESYVAMISTNRSSTYIVYEYIPELVTLCHQLNMNVTNQHLKCEGSNNVERFFITFLLPFFFYITE